MTKPDGPDLCHAARSDQHEPSITVGVRDLVLGHDMTEVVSGDDQPDMIMGPWSSSIVEKVLPKPLVTGVPEPTLGLVGRDQDLVELKRVVGECKVTTITGPGGSGKTRLGIEVAQIMRADFPDGIFFISLTDVVDSSLTIQAVAAAIGVGARCEVTAEDVISRLVDKRALLLFDNCEHLLAECGRLVARIVSACPHVTVLATSRISLKVPGEQLWPIAGLPFPEDTKLPVDVALGYPALQLLMARVRQHTPEFEMQENTVGAMIEICRILAGLPLAIEIVAPRLRSLTPAQVAHQLRGQLLELQNPIRSIPDRHRSLQAALMWSYQLLNDLERQMWCGLSVFVGGFSVETAQELYGSGYDSKNVSEAIASLVDQSLVNLQVGTGRLRIYEPLRQFAHSQLAASGSLEGALLRYRDWCFGALKSNAAGWDTYRSFVDREYQNISAVLKLCYDEGFRAHGLRLALYIQSFWIRCRCLDDGNHWFEAFLNMPGEVPSDVLVDSLQAAAWLYWLTDQTENAERLLQDALLLVADGRDRRRQVLILQSIGPAYGVNGKITKAIETLEQARVLAKQLDDRRYLVATDINLGVFLTKRGEWSRARTIIQEALSANGSALDSLGLIALGDVFRYEGDWNTARTLYQQAVATARSKSQLDGLSQGLQQLGALDIAEGNYDAAVTRYRECLSILEGMGNKSRLAYVLRSFGIEAWARGAISECMTWFMKSWEIYTEILEADSELSLRGVLSPDKISDSPGYRALIIPVVDRLQRECTQRFIQLAILMDVLGDVALIHGHLATAEMFYQEAIRAWTSRDGTSDFLSTIYRTGKVLSTVRFLRKLSVGYIRVVAMCYQSRLALMLPEVLPDAMTNLGLVPRWKRITAAFRNHRKQ